MVLKFPYFDGVVARAGYELWQFFVYDISLHVREVVDDPLVFFEGKDFVIPGQTGDCFFVGLH